MNLISGEIIGVDKFLTLERFLDLATKYTEDMVATRAPGLKIFL